VFLCVFAVHSQFLITSSRKNSASASSDRLGLACHNGASLKQEEKLKLHVREMRLPSRRSFTFAATATERTPLLDYMRVCVHPPVKCVFLGTQILTKKF